MRDSRILMTRHESRNNDAGTDKMYTSMSNGRGMDEKMKENWKRKPYYMLVGKEKK